LLGAYIIRRTNQHLGVLLKKLAQLLVVRNLLLCLGALETHLDRQPTTLENKKLLHSPLKAAKARKPNGRKELYVKSSPEKHKKT
jgi:hypothetical protein